MHVEKRNPLLYIDLENLKYKNQDNDSFEMITHI